MSIYGCNLSLLLHLWYLLNTDSGQEMRHNDVALDID